MQAIKNFLNEEDGSVMIEYGLVAALVAVGSITILTTIGTNLTQVFTRISNALGTANP
jgi:pilus assembly protein Flp/PilA